jgi:hypothetical protein
VRVAAGALQSGAKTVIEDFHIFTAFDQLLGFCGLSYRIRGKGNITLEQATKVQKGSEGTARLFL